uniref:Uncharacterized protein n=1 Tax=Candidatus Kentrum sp. FM TaxID=2126340 RepID=A0A450TXR9_9GAMM|nr:MAG: hypothetical protein BECKFM1743C_GA0114222_107502 [Candidatus Kentron sp. FM]VFJ74077.1 MAG: hypothetical protein BECKFM1743A_GA0114220_107562 [Candidatus Kentron sp. FM]VFK20857.1 MAG: hypothetical protein BECKFM1743B_GA0114221_107352 [Candidatus Kentron sp. FM]
MFTNPKGLYPKIAPSKNRPLTEKDYTKRYPRNTGRLWASTAMGLVAVVFASHAQYIEAADYNYNRQDGSWTGQQNEYATRWDRSTKPWSRELSGAEQSRFDRNGMGYSTGSGQWANESSGQNWHSHHDLANDSRQFPGWGRERQVHAPQSPEVGQLPDPWGRPSGEQRDPWPGSKDWRKPDGWTDRKPASDGWGGQRSGSTSWSQGSGSERPYNAYGNTPWYGRSQSERPKSSRDYSSGGASPATQNAWARDPWAKSPPKGSVRDSGTYGPSSDASSERRYWGHTGETYGENRPWGEHRQKKQSRTERQTGAGATTYNVAPSGTRQHGYPSYPGYPDYLGIGEYGSIYSPGYGLGYNPGYYGWGYQQGLGSAPMVGESPWFSF